MTQRQAERETLRMRLVRRTCRDRGIYMTQAAREMAWGSPSEMYHVLNGGRPRAPSLERVRRWLVRHKARKRSGEQYTNKDLER